MGLHVIGRQALELGLALERDASRVVADVPGVVLAELRERRPQLAGLRAIRVPELDAGALHVLTDERDEPRIERIRRRHFFQRVVQRPGLQRTLAEVDGVPLQPLGDIAHRLVRMHRDPDPALGDDVVELDVQIVQRREDRRDGERRGQVLEPFEDRRRAGEALAVACFELLGGDGGGGGGGLEHRAGA